MKELIRNWFGHGLLVSFVLLFGGVIHKDLSEKQHAHERQYAHVGAEVAIEAVRQDLAQLQTQVQALADRLEEHKKLGLNDLPHPHGVIMGVKENARAIEKLRETIDGWPR